MTCRLFITTIGADGQKLTIPQDHANKDAALDEAERRLLLEKKARSRKRATRGSVLLDLRIECDDGSTMDDDAIRRVTQFPRD